MPRAKFTPVAHKVVAQPVLQPRHSITMTIYPITFPDICRYIYEQGGGYIKHLAQRCPPKTPRLF